MSVTFSLLRSRSFRTAGTGPIPITFGSTPAAVHKLLAKTGQKMSDFDLIEVNEAFAAQVLANGKELDWDWTKVNPNGGAVAIGHPIGASGARVLATLVYELRRRGGGRGLATLCVSGGLGMALALEMVS